MNRIAWWLVTAWVIVREHVAGIRCVFCDARSRLPAPSGWRFETCFDGNARWRCADCVKD